MEKLTEQELLDKLNGKISGVKENEVSNLVAYIMGGNPYNKVFYNPNDMLSLMDAIDKNKSTLFICNADELSGEKYTAYRDYQMNVLFGNNWKSQFQNQVIDKAVNAVSALADTVEHKIEITEESLKKKASAIKANAFGNDTTDTVTENKVPSYEYVNHPSHYNSSSIETIEKMRRIWGNEQTALWCEMTAFKYRDRIGNKPDNSNDQEVGKIKWYENKARELRNQ